MKIYDCIIIGAGPAGLTAGLYSARSKIKTLIIENPYISSQIILTDLIENYPGFSNGINGSELVFQMKEQVKKFNIDFVSEEVKKIYEIKNEKKIFKIITETNEFFSYAVIIATGAIPKKLNVLGESKFIGRGISYCATCDGSFFKDKDIVVIGGGNTAVEEAIFLTKFAKQVVLIHRKDKLRAQAVLQERALKNDKIKFIFNSEVTEILGDKKVSSINILNLKTDESQRLNCDGVFIFIGYEPNTDFLKDFINLNEQGYINVDNKMSASVSGIFAGGDCINKSLRQVITGCGDGANAVYFLQQYLENLTKK